LVRPGDSERVEPAGGAGRRPPDPVRGEEVARAIVVGAGVSGCACAAALADAGVHVTLINSAMDRVGLPAYGPDMVLGETGAVPGPEALLGLLPEPLRGVWRRAAMKPAVGPGAARAAENSDRGSL
jgi:flavin-dependent dehydrogenase